jgi:hypothetical protein
MALFAAACGSLALGCGGGSAGAAGSTSTSAGGAGAGGEGTTVGSGGAGGGTTTSAGGAGGGATTGSGGAGGGATTGSGGGGGATTGAGGAGGGDGGAPPVDPCAGQSHACPSTPVAGYAEGEGLHVVNRCAFPMKDSAQWSSTKALVDQLDADLAAKTITAIAGDLNRDATTITSGQLPGSVGTIQAGFKWSSGDESVAYWTPQGITGSGDAADAGTIGGRKLLLVSWYYDKAKDPGSNVDKGVRLALVDVTNPASIHYRFILLVEPFTQNGHVTFKAVNVHAGGLAWYGDLLYVVDTTKGFRVFDTSRLFQVATDQDQIGYVSGKYYAHSYKYILPQVDRYLQQSSCSPRFSFVSLDRSTSPPSLVAGEYDSASIYGRVYRFGLDPATHRIAGPFIYPEGAWHMGQSHVQGALARSGTFLLSSSKPAGAAGVLYRTKPNQSSKSFGWNDSPEDLSFDPTTSRLWSLSEGLGARYVFAAAITKYIP